MTRTVSTLTSTLCGATIAFTLGAASVLAADDAQIKKGRRSTPRRNARCATPIAGKGSKTNPLDGVGTKLSAEDTKAWIVTAGRDDGEDQVDQEAADAEQVRQAARGRSGRPGGLPAEPEVAAGLEACDEPRRARASSSRSCGHRPHDGQRRGLPGAGRRRRRRPARQSLRRSRRFRRAARAVPGRVAPHTLRDVASATPDQVGPGR